MQNSLLVELEPRFSPHPRVALLAFCLVPSALVTLPDPDKKRHLAKLVDLYEEDFASPESVSHQMVMQLENLVAVADVAAWQTCLPTSPSQAVPHALRTRQSCIQTHGYYCRCSAHCQSLVVRVRDHLAL